MSRQGLEFIVGIFIIAGVISLAFISTKYAKMEVVGDAGYQLIAIFPNIGGLKKGAQVEIAGVQVGRVRDIRLDNYRAKVVMTINKTIQIPDDAIARIKTKGLLGEKYVDILPGGSDSMLEQNQVIRDTQAPVDIEEIISKFVFGKV